MSASPSPPAVFHRVIATHHVHADVRLAPALVGRSMLRVLLTDDTGRPIDHAGVSANIDMASMSMDPAFHALVAGPRGSYVESIQLTMPGHWRIELKVRRPGHATETIDAPVFIDLP